MSEKLTIEQILEICRKYKTPHPEKGKLISTYDLAKEYGVSHSTIQRKLRAYKTYQEKLDAGENVGEGISINLLKKLIPPFAKRGIKANLTSEEQELIMKLAQDPEVAKQLEES